MNKLQVPKICTKKFNIHVKRPCFSAGADRRALHRAMYKGLPRAAAQWGQDDCATHGCPQKVNTKQHQATIKFPRVLAPLVLLWEVPKFLETSILNESNHSFGPSLSSFSISAKRSFFLCVRDFRVPGSRSQPLPSNGST